MEKLIEHTYGNHIYMKIRFEDNSVEEIDVYLGADGTATYKTTADNNPEKRERVIKAYNSLY